jgi:hypothetical protein
MTKFIGPEEYRGQIYSSFLMPVTGTGNETEPCYAGMLSVIQNQVKPYVLVAFTALDPAPTVGDIRLRVGEHELDLNELAKNGQAWFVDAATDRHVRFGVDCNAVKKDVHHGNNGPELSLQFSATFDDASIVTMSEPNMPAHWCNVPNPPESIPVDPRALGQGLDSLQERPRKVVNNPHMSGDFL